ncbi:hypothetical protein OF850_21405 [Roseococcus sp. MDT2-1-1]|uniref:Uncharacterized protein n=1 Tax=Sabulicella glaciei TaxID=2984948 RepID=A0ABT3P169_9PROT|nr:hypothetical protein [Roseococcus sp. MDT2-1-1]
MPGFVQLRDAGSCGASRMKWALVPLLLALRLFQPGTEVPSWTRKPPAPRGTRRLGAGGALRRHPPPR